jgi:hypothetical protein
LLKPLQFSDVDNGLMDERLKIPVFLSHLKQFNELPVPFTQMWFDGKPDFRAVDPAKTMKCVQEMLCAICGRRLGKNWIR